MLSMPGREIDRKASDDCTRLLPVTRRLVRKIVRPAHGPSSLQGSPRPGAFLDAVRQTLGVFSHLSQPCGERQVLEVPGDMRRVQVMA